MNPVIGWGLAVVAVALGWWQFGWSGVLLAVSVVVFWLLLQFSRALRAMKQAGLSPVGHVDNAVMLHARLKPGLTLLQVIQMTRSLGEAVTAPDEQPERWRWCDGGGVSVTLTLSHGRLTQWTLARPDPQTAAGTADAVDGGKTAAGGSDAPTPAPSSR